MRVQNNRQDLAFKQNLILDVGVRRLEQSQMKKFLVQRGLTSPKLLFENVINKPGKILAVDLATTEGKMYDLSKLNLLSVQPKSEHYKAASKAHEEALNTILANPQTKTVYYEA